MNERKEYGRNGQGTNLPGTSLLICSRNRHKMLWESIQSILTGCEIPNEIVVIDQSDSPDPILSNFQPERDCSFRYIWSEQRGVSLGRNMAIAAAAHPILVFTDDDMLMPPTWFGALVRSLLAAGPKGAVTGKVLASEEGNEGFAPSTREDNHPIIYKGRIDRDILFTNNMALYRSAFETIGNFDTRLGPGTAYPAAEDNDLSFRLMEAGYEIVYEPGAANYHRAWRSEKEFLWLHWSYGYGQGAFYAKYFSLKDMYTFRRMVKNIIGNLIRFPYRILLDRRQAQQDMLFVAGLLYGAARWTMDRQNKSS